MAIGRLVAPIVESAPAETEETLRRWSSDSDFWLRRASLLALLPALRAGGGDFDLFCGLTSTMLGEREFFIRKAIGWVLRDTSKKRPELVFAFLDQNIGRVSALSLREGSKYLSNDQRRKLQTAFEGR
jgi:3-methyladenine DNA glycosylase AlkD